MDRGVWQAIVHGVKESDMTESLTFLRHTWGPIRDGLSWLTNHDVLLLVLPQSSLTTWVQTYKKSTVGASRVGLFQCTCQKNRPQNPTRELARFLLIWWPSHDNKTKGVWATGDWWMGRKESREWDNTLRRLNHSSGKSGWKSMFEKWRRTLE